MPTVEALLGVPADAHIACLQYKVQSDSRYATITSLPATLKALLVGNRLRLRQLRHIYPFQFKQLYFRVNASGVSG